MKRWLYSLTIFGLVAMAACAGEEETTPSPSGPAPTASAAWEQEWGQVLAAAKREGKVVVAGPSGADTRRALTEPFEQKYGITVEYQPFSGPEFVPKVKAEREANLYLWDLFIGGTSTPVLELRPAGILDPIEPALILPEVKDGKNLMGGQPYLVDKDRTVLGTTASGTPALVINTNMVKAEEFRSYKDILDPKWKGKIMMHDPRISGSGQSRMHFFYVNPQLGPDFIRALARQEPMIGRDQNENLTGLAQGKAPICVGCSESRAGIMIRAGAPIALVGPDQMKEGGSTSVSSGGVGLISKRPHPNAAAVYLNWLLSKEGQTGFSKAEGIASRRVDVPTDHLDPWAVPKPAYIPLDGEEALLLRRNVVLAFVKEVFGE